MIINKKIYISFFIGISIAALPINIKSAFSYRENFPKAVRYTIGGVYTLLPKDSYGIQHIEIRDEDKTIRLQNFLDLERPNGKDLPSGGFVMEVRMEGCGRKWKKSELIEWQRISLKKKTRLGGFVYHTLGRKKLEGFQHAIFYSKRNVKFSAHFNDNGSNIQTLYKILSRVKSEKNICLEKPQLLEPVPGVIQEDFRPDTITDEQIWELVNTSVPAEIIYEKIVFAVNKDFADKYPNWKQQADRVLGYINEILAKNTKKQLLIERYMTYEPGENIDSTLQLKMQNNPAYYYDNNTSSKSYHGGLTVIYYVHTNAKLGGAGGDNFINGKNYGFAVIKEEEAHTTLRPIEDFLQENKGILSQEEEYLQRVKTFFAHEVGHALGLAVPDTYNFYYADGTGMLPQLNYYNYNDRAPTDIMNHSSNLVYFKDIKLSDFQAFILNHNLYHRFLGNQISKALPKKIIVRVKNSAGEPLSGANVKIFGIDKSYRIFNLPEKDHDNPKYFLLKQTLQTDHEGEVEIPNPDELTLIPPINAVFDSEIIKVEKDGKYRGSYLTRMDLLETRLLKNMDIYYLDIVIE